MSSALSASASESEGSDSSWFEEDGDGDGDEEEGSGSEEGSVLDDEERGSYRQRTEAGTRRGRGPKEPASNYRGVAWNNGKWQARIREQAKCKALGIFDTEKAAARAYDERVKKLHHFPILNFLPDGSLNPDRKKLMRVNPTGVKRM